MNMLEALIIPSINKLLWIEDTEKVANGLVYIINNALDIVAPKKKTQLRNNYAPGLSMKTKELMNVETKLKLNIKAHKLIVTCWNTEN